MSQRNPFMTEISVPAPIDQIWQAMRDPEEIRQWFGWDYVSLDQEIDGIFVGGAQASDEARTITIENGDKFELEPRGDRTVVRLTRPAPVEGDDVFDEVSEGWVTFLQQLRFYVAHHDGEERRTLQFHTKAAPSPLEALGLGDVAQITAGDRYEAQIATGETIAGEVWFRTNAQTGLLVEGYRDGLLVVATEPGGGGRVVLTTYGMDDAEFEALSTRWGDWWRETYE